MRPAATLLALLLSDFWLRRGTGDGTFVERRAFDGKTGKRRLGVGMYGTTAQIANAAGIAAIGAAFFAIEAASSALPALFAAFAVFTLSIIASAAFLSWMRRALT
jgi:hypothetical protein